MEIAARLTSTGQLTLPNAITDALGLREGDRVLFRIEGDHAILARTADLLELAGTVPVPPELRGADWADVRDRAWQARAAQLTKP